MLPNLSPCETKLSYQLSAFSSLQHDNHQTFYHIQLLKSQDCNSTYSLFKVYTKAVPGTADRSRLKAPLCYY